MDVFFVTGNVSISYLRLGIKNRLIRFLESDCRVVIFLENIVDEIEFWNCKLQANSIYRKWTLTFPFPAVNECFQVSG